MTAIVAESPEERLVDDAVLGYLADILNGVGGLVVGGGAVDDAIRIDRISLLEQIKGAICAVQAAETVKFAQSQVAGQREAGVDYRKLGRGIAEQIGLATKTSGWYGARRLTLARDLWFELPATYDLLVRGQISEYVAQLVVGETSHLDADTRQQIDKELVAAGLHTMAPKTAAAAARRLAYAADPAGSLARGRKARMDRRVTCRPAPDTMVFLNALLPVEQGVACYAALKEHTDTVKASGDDRSRDQIMADRLVERLTGQASADDIDAEVNIVLPVDALVDPDDPTPAEIPGYGPIPAGLAGEIIGRSSGQLWWRRLFTAPTIGGAAIVGGDPTRRRFTGRLGELIKLRDYHACREPFCTAPIRHIDHIVSFRDGGPTTYTNGRGVCERHNHVREMPGWQITLITEHPHAVITTTPTGHSYLSRAPNPP